jgi:hypothetical protein
MGHLSQGTFNGASIRFSFSDFYCPYDSAHWRSFSLKSRILWMTPITKSYRAVAGNALGVYSSRRHLSANTY